MYNFSICFRVVFPLRKPMDSLSRIFFCRLVDTNPKKFNFLNTLSATLNAIELRMSYDLCINECFIIDIKGVTMGHALAINPLLLAKAVHLYQVHISFYC